jgi:hypothetical protein
MTRGSRAGGRRQPSINRLSTEDAGGHSRRRRFELTPVFYKLLKVLYWQRLTDEVALVAMATCTREEGPLSRRLYALSDNS